MRKVRKLVIHCSACRPAAARTQCAKDIDRMHRERGWRKIGYHYFVKFDGTIEKGRAEDEVGSGVLGHNADSIHVCYAGGLDDAGKPLDTRSSAQKSSLAKLAFDITARHGIFDNGVVGHRDLSPDKDKDGVVEEWEWLKHCPCFSVQHWWRTLNGKARP